MIKKIIWIVIFAGFLIYLIPKLLETLSLFIDDSNTLDEVTNSTVLIPPVIDSIPEATNSARLQISGYADQADRVEIFVNNISKKDISVVSRDSSFSTTVPLYKGENAITIVAINKNGDKSNPTEPFNVVYRSDGPELIVDSPQDDSEIKGDDSTLEIRGITDTDATLTINDRWVRIKTDGTFSHALRLSEGENTIEITAKDPAGNSKIVTRLVRYSK